MSFAKELRESFDERLIGRKDIAGDGSFISLLVGNFLIDREIGEGIDFFLKQGDQVVVRGRLMTSCAQASLIKSPATAFSRSKESRERK